MLGPKVEEDTGSEAGRAGGGRGAPFKLGYG
jgi:hypothetical protein